AAVREHRLPLAPLRDLLSAFAQDVSVTRYASFDALADYCRRSANPVGRLLLALYDRDSDANRRASDAICTGLQLANFWQDVAIDWRKGRVYVPREDLDRFGVPESQIADGIRDERWSRLMRFETLRTRALFTAGRPLVRRLPWRAGIELAAVIAGGTRILERIDAVDGDVFGHRPTLGMFDWMIVAGRALVPRRRSVAATS
ncbi:MAG: squalene/phytoene synthase family protein, partial [Casimicrobiaceae bacterium]